MLLRSTSLACFNGQIQAEFSIRISVRVLLLQETPTNTLQLQLQLQHTILLFEAMTTSPPTSSQQEKDINSTMEEEEVKPFVSADSNYFNLHGERLRRRGSSIRRRSGPPLPTRSRSFKGDISHAASETYLMTAFALKLLSYLGVGYRWLIGLYALGIYAMLLLPGFLHVAYYYFFSRNVRRSIVYGDQPRNRLDLFLPKNTDGLKPVLIFVTGGAWIIGYKAWGALLGLHLSERDVIVACLDYRNFPQGTISDMVSDVCQGISFVFNNISEYGGDPTRIFLMGQSAGGHISTCALLDQAIVESEGRSVTWSTSQVKAYFGLSGGYNLLNLVDHFHGRGLYRTIFLSIMEGEESLAYFSPEIRIRDPSISDAIPLLPQFILFHGTADCSIPSDESKAFHDTLHSVGAKAKLILYPGKTHTDLFLQDPMRGDDELFDYTLAFIHAGDKKALEKDAAAPPRSRLVPEILIKLAHIISPF